MTAAPDILYRQAAALLEQSNTAQALPLLQQAAEQGYTEAAAKRSSGAGTSMAGSRRDPTPSQGTLYPTATTRTQRHSNRTASQRLRLAG